MAIDTHCHLFDEAFKDDYKEVIARAKENGFQKLVLVGFHKSNNKLAFDISSEYDFIYPTCGIHPEYASETTFEDLLELEEFIQTHNVYAIGECGLDYYWQTDNKNKQKEVFEAQIKLALKYDLPLVIHSRDSIADIYDILAKYPKLRFVMHSFSGSPEMLLRFIKLGAYIGFSGPVTYKNSINPKECAAICPLDRMLLETDCPYLTPVPNRGKRNEPSYARYTLEKIAEIKNMDVKELEDIFDSNSISFFNLD